MFGQLRNRYWLLGLLLVSVGAVAAEPLDSSKQGVKKQPQQYLIGFAQDTLGNDWRLAQVSDLKKSLSGIAGIKLIITDAKGHTAKQISDIEDLISRNIDLLITSPMDAVALTPVVSKAYKQGIPVILLDRGIATDNFTTLIGADNRSIARDAARYLINTHPQGGNILILKGVPNATPTIHRTANFLKVITENRKFNVVAQKTANYLRGDAIKAVEDMLASNTAFDIIYAQSDSMATGARMALKLAGKDLRKFSIIGIDYIKEAQAAIREGTQLASFTYPTGGKEGGEYALKILQGKKVKKRVIIKSQIITRKNVNSFNPIF